MPLDEDIPKADNPNPDPDHPRPKDNSKHAATNSIVAETEQLPAPADKHGERSIAAACLLLVASLPENVLQKICAAACQLLVASPPAFLLNGIGHHPTSSSVPESAPSVQRTLCRRLSNLCTEIPVNPVIKAARMPK